MTARSSQRPVFKVWRTEMPKRIVSAATSCPGRRNTKKRSLLIEELTDLVAPIITGLHVDPVRRAPFAGAHPAGQGSARLFRRLTGGKAEIHMFQKGPAHDQRRPFLPPGNSVLPATGLDASQPRSSFHTMPPGAILIFSKSQGTDSRYMFVLR